MTYREDCALPAELLEQVQEQGLDVLPELIRVSLKTTGSTFVANGNINLDVNGSGVFVNSSSSCAMSVNGNVDLEVDTAYQIVGTYCQNGNITRVGPIQAATQIPYPPQIDIPAPDFITCSGNGYKSGNTYYPGNYNNLTINGNGNYAFAPGNYCLDNGATINGNINLTANGVNFRINSGGFDINGNSTFICNNVIVYGAGGSGMHFNGNGQNSCTGIVF